MKNTLVKASEIGDYIYCKRCWWKKFHGYVKTTQQMLLGIKGHNQTFSKVQTWQSTKEVIKFVGLIILFLFIFLLLIKLFVFKDI